MNRFHFFFLTPSMLLVLAGCGGHDHDAKSGHGHDHGSGNAHAHGTAPAAADPHAGHDHGDSTAIALTATVRENLGITFTKAEYRVVQGLLRLPGRYEAEPNGRRSYQAPLAGRVEVLVQPYQRVAAGDPLYRVASADWNLLQRDLAVAMVAAQLAGERYAAAQAHAQAVEQATAMWQERAANLQRLAKEIGGKASELAEASGRAAELLIQQAESRTRLAELKREAVGVDGSSETGLAAIRLRHLLANAARITGLDVASLTADTGKGPQWQTIEDLVVVARSAGVVEGDLATSGTWLEERSTVLTIIDPAQVLFRASALQADLAKLRDGLPARIVASDAHDPIRIDAAVVLAPTADALDRSVELIARPAAGAALPAGVRPGVTALLEITVAGSADEELAIPLAATIRDGVKLVFFKRNRANLDVVEKVEADVGLNDGRWVIVQSGVKEGDEVIVGGLYPLMLSQQQGGGAVEGHFEADGSFHAGKH